MQTKAEPVQRHRVALALPGVTFHFGCMHAAVAAGTSPELDVFHIHSNEPFENLNTSWATGLNMFEAGAITHFAMIHSDIWPTIEFGKRDWLAVLIGEMDRLNASLISVAVPIKDDRGLFSCGIGDPNYRWTSFRRLTSREFMKLPETINAADMGYPDGMLLHNNGMWVCDLRYEQFFATDENGDLKCFFDYPKKIARHKESGGTWKLRGESEDWFFSRQIHELGLRNTYITRKVSLTHPGFVHYPNDDRLGKDGWGRYQADEDNRAKWDPTYSKNGHSNEKGKTHATCANAEERGIGRCDSASGDSEARLVGEQAVRSAG